MTSSQPHSIPLDSAAPQSVEMSDLNGSDTATAESRPTDHSRLDTATEVAAVLQQPVTSPSGTAAASSAADAQAAAQAHSSAGQTSETGAATTMSSDTSPAVLITLLLPSTGTRHAFRIDSRYLKQRSPVTSTPASPTLAQAVDGAADAVAGKQEPEVQEPHEEVTTDPWTISVYTLKELIWRDWRDNWELRPTSPSAIRLIHFGRLLDDKSALGDLKFNTTSTNMVHMSVKPADFDEDDTAGSKLGKVTSRSSGYRSRRGGNNGNNNNTADQADSNGERTSPSCRCSIM